MELDNTDRGRQAKKLWDMLYQEISWSKLLSEDKMHVSYPEDGSIVIELTLDHCRLGIAVEVDSSESGWYFVSRKMAKSGDMESLDIPQLVRWAENVLKGKKAENV